MSETRTLNEQAHALADHLADRADSFRIAVHRTPGGSRILDCGVEAGGGLQAGLGLALVCLSDRAEVTLAPGTLPGLPCPQVQVSTDHPVLACMASQYAGWQIQVGKFFAMGSGPMRAAYGKEELFNDIPGREKPPVAVGVLETGKLPDEEVCAYIAERAGVGPDRLTLLTAPAASLAGTVQVVARSVETALHKLHGLHFPLEQVVAGFGTAPLPPVAPEMVGAIGRTNDAILYGGQVTLWVRCDDADLAKVGPRVPSSSSSDHGAPFAEIFRRYGGDFYLIDGKLFSPARVTFHNLTTGKSHTFGKLEEGVLQKSFFGA